MTVYNILDYGAVADGITNSAAAIQKAVDVCSVQGGGRVLIPAGRFLSGTIELKSHVDLHLESGAELICSLNREDIINISAAHQGEDGDESWEDGWEDGCFLGGIHAEHVSITGSGTIYGQGDRIFYDDGADGGLGECPKNVRGFRPRLMLFEDISDFRVEGVTLKDAAMWTLHMAGCRRVRVQNIQILNDVRGANNDGIDPDCCQDVIINGCVIQTGDDAIVVKSTKMMAKKYGPCRDIIITGCILHSHDSALKVGTETHGDIRNVVFSDCVIQDCSRAVGIWVRDGGTVEDIHIHHLTGAVRRYADCPQREFAPRWWGKGEPVFVSAAYRNEEKQYPGTIRSISLDHISLKCESCIFLGAEEASPIRHVTMDHMHLTMEQQGTQPADVFDEQPSPRGVYPHDIPAFYARYVDGLRVEAMTVWKTAANAADKEGKESAENQLVQLESCQRAEVNVQVEIKDEL